MGRLQTRNPKQHECQRIGVTREKNLIKGNMQSARAFAHQSHAYMNALSDIRAQ